MQDGAARLPQRQLVKSDLDPTRRGIFQNAYSHLVSRVPGYAWTSGQCLTERDIGASPLHMRTLAGMTVEYHATMLLNGLHHGPARAGRAPAAVSPHPPPRSPRRRHTTSRPSSAVLASLHKALRVQGRRPGCMEALGGRRLPPTTPRRSRRSTCRGCFAHLCVLRHVVCFAVAEVVMAGLLGFDVG